MFINSRGKGLWGKDIVEITKRLKNNDETSLLNVKLAKKDKSVFSELIQANLTSMYRVAKGILSSQDDIEDALQTTTLIAFDKINTLRNDKYFKTWLIRILINECNKLYNRNRKSLKDIKEVKEESYTIDKSINIDLYNAINKLSDELRVTTILFYFNDLTYKEISKVLDIPEGTVKSRISRAKDRLYIMLKD